VRVAVPNERPQLSVREASERIRRERLIEDDLPQHGGREVEQICPKGMVHSITGQFPR